VVHSTLGGSRRSRTGRQSYAESSFAGGSQASEAQNLQGVVDADWITVLRKTTKRKKVPITLPPDLVPEVRIDLLPQARNGAPRTLHEGHCLSVINNAATGNRRAPVENVLVVGGQVRAKEEAPAQAMQDRAPASPRVRQHRRKSEDGSGPSSLSAAAASGSSVSPPPPGPSQRQSPSWEKLSEQQRTWQGLSSFRLCEQAGGSVQLEWQVAGTEMPRCLTSATACAVGNGSYVAVFGGLAAGGVGGVGEATRALYIFDTMACTWRDETALPDAPPPTFDHAAGAFDGTQTMIVHGGRGSSNPGSATYRAVHLLELSGASWQWQVLASRKDVLGQLKGIQVLTESPARRSHTLTTRHGALTGAMVFGGYGEDDQVTADLHVLDLERCIWMAIDGAGAVPSARAHHTATLLGPYLAIYGGVDSKGTLLKDLHLLHVPTMLWCIPNLAPMSRTPNLVAADALGHAETRGSREAGTGGKRKSKEVAHDFGSGGSPDKSRASPERERTTTEAPESGFESSSFASLAQKFAPEFCARAGHAAVPITAGCGPAECAMLIFGGRNSVGDTLGDAHRLVLSMPKEPGGGPLHRHPDTVLGYVVKELEKAIQDALDEHEEQMAEGQERLNESREEVRNMQTRTLSVRAQKEKKDAVLDAARDREAKIMRQVAQVNAEMRKMAQDTKTRLRELEIEAESLEAKVQRVNRDQVADFEGLIGGTEDLSLAEGHLASRISNPLNPLGLIERRGDVQWKGALVSTEIYWYEVPETSSTATTPLPYHPSPTPSSPCPPSQPTDDDATSSRVSTQKQIAECRLTEEAARSELKILRLLKHPNLQEVYGAVADLRGLFLIMEPLLETLAARMERDRRSGGEALLDSARLFVSCDLATALAYLHAKGVTHRHIIAENCFVQEQNVSITAKLGGHASARIACRVKGELLVPKLGAREDLAICVGETRSCSKGFGVRRRLGAGDARPGDIHAFGEVLLQLWRPPEDDQWLEEDFEAQAAMQRASDAGCLDETAAEAIVDASVRFVVGACLVRDSAKRPSARVVQVGLTSIQEGDVQELPFISDDPTRLSTLADIAVDDRADRAG